MFISYFDWLMESTLHTNIRNGKYKVSCWHWKLQQENKSRYCRSTQKYLLMFKNKQVMMHLHEYENNFILPNNINKKSIETEIWCLKHSNYWDFLLTRWTCFLLFQQNLCHFILLDIDINAFYIFKTSSKNSPPWILCY